MVSNGDVMCHNSVSKDIQKLTQLWYLGEIENG